MIYGEYIKCLVGGTMVCFVGTKNSPIQVEGTVEDFFNVHLTK